MTPKVENIALDLCHPHAPGTPDSDCDRERLHSALARLYDRADYANERLQAVAAGRVVWDLDEALCGYRVALDEMFRLSSADSSPHHSHDLPLLQKIASKSSRSRMASQFLAHDMRDLYGDTPAGPLAAGAANRSPVAQHLPHE